MSARPMKKPPPVFVLLAAALAVLGACLPDDPPVKGRLLYKGIGIEHPEFVGIDGKPWVMFETRLRRPVLNGLGGELAVHLVNWQDPSQYRLLLPARAERPLEWPRVGDGAGALFYMVDERRPTQGLAVSVGTLQRVRLDMGVLESIEDVMSYSMHPSRQRFIYRKHRPDVNHAELHLRDLNGQDRNLGLLTGQMQFHGPERIYFIGGEDQTLTRVDGFAGQPEKLRTRVSRFTLHPSEKFAIISTVVDGRPRTLIFELDTKIERALPVENPSYWLELRGETFLFSEGATQTTPAVLHFYDIRAPADHTYTLPDGVPNVMSLMGRPPEYRDALAFDSRGVITVFRPEQATPFETTNLRPTAPSFTPDGRYLIYLEPEPPPPPPAVSKYPTGKLMAQSTDNWQSPPRQLSPKGASVPADPIGYRQRPGEEFQLLFWARYGLGGSDLYLSNYDTGAHVKVAEGIGAVSVGERHVLGVVRLGQDLTGDLVFRDFVDGREQLVETGVSDMHITYDQMLGDLVAFVVRERRVQSPRNGLWATTLMPLEPDPGPETKMLVRPE